MVFKGIDFETYLKQYPNREGYFGRYGGAYISDELKKAMEEITEAYFTIAKSSKFVGELRRIRREFQGRPTPLTLSDFPIIWEAEYSFTQSARI